MFTIRPAVPEDAQRLSLIDREALGYDYPPEKTKKQLEKMLSSSDCRVFAAEADGMVVGYIHGADYDCLYSDPLKNVMALAVLSEYRGQGIGKALLGAIEDWEKEAGCAGVRLVSRMERTQAHGFYMHCGYVPRKQQQNFIKYL